MPEFVDTLNVKAGAVVFEEGDPGDKAFLIRAGAVRIVKERNGEAITLGIVRQGGIFGEMALIDSQPRMARAVAEEDLDCVVISNEVFSDKLHRADPFLRQLLNVFVQHIRSVSEGYASLQTDAAERSVTDQKGRELLT